MVVVKRPHDKIVVTEDVHSYLERLKSLLNNLSPEEFSTNAEFRETLSGFDEVFRLETLREIDVGVKQFGELMEELIQIEQMMRKIIEGNSPQAQFQEIILKVRDQLNHLFSSDSFVLYEELEVRGKYKINIKNISHEEDYKVFKEIIERFSKAEYEERLSISVEIGDQLRTRILAPGVLSFLNQLNATYSRSSGEDYQAWENLIATILANLQRLYEDFKRNKSIWINNLNFARILQIHDCMEHLEFFEEN